MKYEIGDELTDESGRYKGRVCIVWNDGDICTIEQDAAHPNPRHLTSHSSRAAEACTGCVCLYEKPGVKCIATRCKHYPPPA